MMEDYLLTDIQRAEKAGMTYGKFVAMYGCTPRDEPKPEPQIKKICAYCGKVFYVKKERNQRYCSEFCYNEMDNKRVREAKQGKRAKLIR